MLDAMRRGAQSWIAKILFGLLVVSFAIWGVADVFRGYGAGELARVGDTEITTEEFRQSYNLQLEDIRRRFGGRITPEQARAFGLDNQVLSRLIGSAAVDTHARRLQLGLSDATIAAAIQRDPMFQGPDGTFSRAAFDQFLRQNGLSERGFVGMRRKDELREQITDTLLKGLSPPGVAVDLIYRYREETRVAQHFTIDAEATIKLAEPTEAQLAATYEQNKRRFVYPEYRKLAVLLLTAEEVRKRIAVSDADVQAAYEQAKESYNEPERRRLQQIAFADKTAADQAARALADGKSFLEVAKAAGAKDSDIELGLLAKKDMIDPKIAEAAFALPTDQPSGVIEGQFSTVILRVTEIQPGKQRTLEEVKGQIRDRLAGERASPEIQKLHDQVDDNRSSGKTLKEIADLLKLKFVEVASTDKSGKAPDGKPAFEGPDGDRVVRAAFDAKAGVENEAVEISDGGYAWLDVVGTTPEKQKELAEVKADVKTVWIETERRKALSALADKLAERAGRGEPLDALAREAGGKVETTQPFKRFGATAGLPETAVNQAFAVAKGAAASAETSDGKSRIVLKVTEVNLPSKPTKDQADRLRDDLARQLQGDIIAEYVAALQERLGVSINQAELRRATGADRQ
jgi:peptidyl-prolyl cis-trans isomerase D